MPRTRLQIQYEILYYRKESLSALLEANRQLNISHEIHEKIEALQDELRNTPESL